jgi:two-component system, NarL family, sensor kinase
MNLRLQLVALAVLPLVIAILSITALHTWQSASLAKSSIATFEANSLAAKKDEIVNLTSLAMSAIQGANGEAGSEDAEAKRRVIEIIRGLDYGEDGYFFVYDYDGMGVVHPRQDFRPGRNWLDLTDPDGTKVIARLIETAPSAGPFLS